MSKRARMTRLVLVGIAYCASLACIIYLMIHEPLVMGVLILLAVRILIDATERGPL